MLVTSWSSIHTKSTLWITQNYFHNDNNVNRILTKYRRVSHSRFFFFQLFQVLMGKKGGVSFQALNVQRPCPAIKHSLPILQAYMAHRSEWVTIHRQNAIYQVLWLILHLFWLWTMTLSHVPLTRVNYFFPLKMTSQNIFVLTETLHH